MTDTSLPPHTHPGTRPATAPTAQRVQTVIDQLKLDAQVVELAVPARTAAQAAEALGVAVGQIAKSLVFRGAQTGHAVLVVCAGDVRVDEALLAAQIGEATERATPDFVREHSGFAIGGVAPIGHTGQVNVLLDESLRRFERVWAAGGTPHAVVPLQPDALAAATGRPWVRVCSSPG
ncbi:YbaK/EbsC family protein [Piscinibacterium candidicorallinum]|uniref:YbaK/EbsC family protein n=1 Tax=Piscinibacterium candidicorallinum TaxID=1793872 RepID=A0ABV7HA06_9BURK